MTATAMIRRLGRHLVLPLLLVTALAVGLAAPADAASTTSVGIAKSGGQYTSISLECGGRWKSIRFFYGATDSWLIIRPVSSSARTYRRWDSRGEAHISYVCSGSTTRVTFRYLGDVIDPGTGPV